MAVTAFWAMAYLAAAFVFIRAMQEKDGPLAIFGIVGLIGAIGLALA